MTPGDLIGIVGAVLILLAYFLLQRGTLSSGSPRYLWTNIAGSSCIIASLVIDWNLGSFIINATWIVISAYGLWKHRAKA